MRIFLCVSLIITKVSAGPSLFSASIIAAEVGALLCKRQKWLHRNHISHGSFIHGLEPHARHAFSPISTDTHCSGLRNATSFALRRSPDLDVCPPTLFLGPSCGVLYSPAYIFHTCWVTAGLPQQNTCSLREWCEFVYMLMLLFPSRS